MKEDITAANALQQRHKLREELHATNTKPLETCKHLQQEKERNIELENYSRREKLKFKNIPETQNESIYTITTKEIILDILNNKMNVDTSKLSFQVMHRIGKKRNGNRPWAIIVRFVCHKDHDAVLVHNCKVMKNPHIRSLLTLDIDDCIETTTRMQTTMSSLIWHIYSMKYNQICKLGSVVNGFNSLLNANHFQ